MPDNGIKFGHESRFFFFFVSVYFGPVVSHPTVIYGKGVVDSLFFYTYSLISSEYPGLNFLPNAIFTAFHVEWYSQRSVSRCGNTAT